jgi:hypothetical protein
MKILSKTVISAAVLMTLVGCRNSPAQNSPMELRVYSVPAARTADLARALNDSLSTLKAHASVAMPGKVLVYAPHDTQTSIGTAIDDLAKSTPASPAGQPPLSVSFWMIDAKPGAGEDDPALAPMRSLLDALRVAMGPHHFSLMESVSGVSSDAISLIRTTGHDFQFRTIQNNEGIRLVVNYSNYDSSPKNQADIGSMQTEMTAQLGQYEVLARTMAETPNNAQPTEASSPTLRLLVARVDATDPKK